MKLSNDTVLIACNRSMKLSNDTVLIACNQSMKLSNDTVLIACNQSMKLSNDTVLKLIYNTNFNVHSIQPVLYGQNQNRSGKYHAQ